MSDFTSVYPEANVLDPSKRVNYIHGLVLGVDEFKQEELYLLEKDKSHNRSLHGYGTVCGLKVEPHTGAAGQEIKVHPGMAVSPSGQVIQVPRTQCAVLDQWLASHGEEIAEYIGSPAIGSMSLYLMLCYRECKTDIVPIPTGPCQSLEESTAPSRTADDFSLSFELAAPTDIHFQSSMKDLTDLLLTIPVEVNGAMTLDELKGLVRSLIPDTPPEVVPSSPPEFVPSSPPLSSPALSDAIAPENVEEYFNAAFLVWVTEVKPCLLTVANNAILTVPSDTSDKCVFLAQINFDVITADGITRIDPLGEVVVDESLRQYLLNTQAMQNYLGPLSTWAKTLADFIMPEELAGPIDESELVHITGNETISGSKTFSAPLILEADARVLKRVSQPAYQSHHGRGATRSLFSDTLPAMHFLTTGPNAFGGEANFTIPIPNDMDYSEGMQFRLVWGFQGGPEPSDIAFDWRVGAQFYEANQSVPRSPLEFVNVGVAELSVRRNDVLATPFQDFDADISFSSSHQYGVVRVSMLDPGPAISQVYLLQVEIQYTANSLGRSLSP
ncbi:MAG: hypothetical protein ACI9Y1_003195 [Lentisphaeria bacterium]|jgi:hypothetical protein